MRVARATFSDLFALLEANRQLTLREPYYAALLAQVALSEAYAVYASPRDRHPLAIAGLASMGHAAGELWFLTRAGGLGRHLLPIVRLARRMLPACSLRYPGGFLCLVLPGNSDGERVARLIEFHPTGVIFNDHQEWVWSGEHGQLGGRREATASGGAAAPDTAGETSKVRSAA